MEVAGKLQAPIVHAMRGKECIEYDNPFDVGMTGLLGFASGYYAMMTCETLLMLGTDFPYQQFYPEQATIVQIDLRGEQIGPRTKVDVGLLGDVKTTLAALAPRLTPKRDHRHLKDALQVYQRARQGLDDLATGEPGRRPIHPQYVARVLNEVAAEDAIFSCDVGTPTIWAARYLTMNGKRRLLGSFNHGSMANALPQAIGAQLSHPDRQVITLSGDGGLAMLLGELLTLRQQGLPVKVVVFNNSALSFVELEMKAAGIVTFATDLDNPDFAGIAQATGLFSARVERADDLEAALQAAFDHDGPALVDVVTARQELSLPPSLTREQVTGFTLFATRTILSGQGSELIDLNI